MLKKSLGYAIQKIAKILQSSRKNRHFQEN